MSNRSEWVSYLQRLQKQEIKDDLRENPAVSGMGYRLSSDQGGIKIFARKADLKKAVQRAKQWANTHGKKCYVWNGNKCIGAYHPDAK